MPLRDHRAASVRIQRCLGERPVYGQTTRIGKISNAADIDEARETLKVTGLSQ
jgi:hypothetical protein